MRQGMPSAHFVCGAWTTGPIVRDALILSWYHVCLTPKKPWCGLVSSLDCALIPRMNDVVTTDKRSLMMSGIRGRDTGPELRVRRILHALGYRFRLHRKDLPGSPDVVLPKHKVAIFIHGCFWHFHQGCRFAKMPRSREEFWQSKLLGNRERDAAAVAALREVGWRVLLIWECFLRANKNDVVLSERLAAWVEGDQGLGEFSNAGLLQGSDVAPEVLRTGEK